MKASVTHRTQLLPFGASLWFELTIFIAKPTTACMVTPNLLVTDCRGLLAVRRIPFKRPCREATVMNITC